MKRFNKSILLPSLLFLTIGAGFAFFSPRISFMQDEAEAKFRDGLTLMNQYQYEAASDLFLESLSLNPEFHIARRYLGQVLYFSGQPNEAISEWEVIFDQGGYDPSLELHLQSLRSVTIDSEINWTFKRIIEPEQGYRFSYPTFVGTHNASTVFILSLGQVEAGSLLEINPDGTYNRILRKVTEKLEAPMGAAQLGNQLWITDFKGDKIHRLDLAENRPFTVFQTLTTLGTTGSGDNQFRGPAGICSTGKFIYVADNGNHRVHKISPEGKFILSFQKVANNFRLNDPFGIECLPNGRILVTEPSESRISVFDEFGNFIEFMGTEYLKRPRHLFHDEGRNNLLIADEKQGVFIVNLDSGKKEILQEFRAKDEKEKETILRPFAATIDEYGNLFVADHGSHRLIHFVPQQYLYSNLELWIERIIPEQFPSVGIYAVVKDQNGNIITGLSDRNFRIIENDAEVPMLRTDYLSQFEDQSTTLFLLSRSIDMSVHHEALTWIMDSLTNGIRQKDQIRILSYGDDSRFESPWTSSKLRLLQATRRIFPEPVFGQEIQSESRVALGKSLYQGISELLPKKGKRALIWLHEGDLALEGFQDFSLTRLENFANINHIPIFIVSFKNPVTNEEIKNQQYLSEWARRTGGELFSAYDSLKNLSAMVQAKEEERTFINYSSEANSEWKDQFMDLKLIVNFQGRTGIENGGYFIP